MVQPLATEKIQLPKAVNWKIKEKWRELNSLKPPRIPGGEL